MIKATNCTLTFSYLAECWPKLCSISKTSSAYCQSTTWSINYTLADRRFVVFVWFVFRHFSTMIGLTLHSNHWIATQLSTIQPPQKGLEIKLTSQSCNQNQTQVTSSLTNNTCWVCPQTSKLIPVESVHRRKWLLSSIILISQIVNIQNNESPVNELRLSRWESSSTN